MTSERRRLAWAAIAAGGLFVLLVLVSGVGPQDLRAPSPPLIALGVLCAAATVALRAANYRLISGAGAPLGAWLDATLRHQALFSLVPTGLGDLGFPVLARRHVGTGWAAAAAIIAFARARDLLLLGALVAIALAAGGHAPWPVALVAAPLSGLAVRVELAGRLACRAAAWAGHRPPAALAAIAAAPARARWAGTACATASWLCAAAGAWCVYSAAGVPLDPWDALVLLAALNLAGAVAVTVGGLGFAEAGSAAALAWLGTEPALALRQSVLARPMLLFTILAACALLWALRRAPLPPQPLRRP